RLLHGAGTELVVPALHWPAQNSFPAEIVSARSFVARRLSSLLSRDSSRLFFPRSTRDSLPRDSRAWLSLSRAEVAAAVGPVTHQWLLMGKSLGKRQKSRNDSRLSRLDHLRHRLIEQY